MDRGQRPGIGRIGERLADGDLGDSCDRDDLAGTGFARLYTLESLSHEQLADPRRLDAAVVAAPRHRLAATDRALHHSAQREPAEEGRGVEVRHQRLQPVARHVGRRGDPLQ